MADSTSDNSNFGPNPNPNGTVDNPEILQSFGNLKVTEDGNLKEKTSNHKEMEKLLSISRGSISSLMVDEKQYPLFRKLIEGCESLHLDTLVTELFSDIPLFIGAAFIDHGSSNIKKLIRKLKDTDHAFTLTKILSTKFLDIATHPLARDVIETCLDVFGSGPNEVLYIQVLQFYQELAIDEVGCGILYECINALSGDQRMKLLNDIAHSSDYLSNDPIGNYVVQYVLELRNSMVNETILSCLQGQFISLALQKGASQIVEKCMELCESGIIIVIMEILQAPKGPYQLARDQCGHYVIMKALDLSEKQGHIFLYESLDKALRPYFGELNRTRAGNCVINVLKRRQRLS